MQDMVISVTKSSYVKEDSNYHVHSLFFGICEADVII